MHDVREIGRRSSFSLGGGGVTFEIGDIFADFHWEGEVADAKERLKISASGSDNS